MLAGPFAGMHPMPVQGMPVQGIPVGMPQMVVQQNEKRENKPKYSEATGYVSSWVRNIRFLCATTIIFSLFAFLFAGLTIYSSDGETIEPPLDFESRSFVLTPTILPIIFLFFGSVQQFATARYNQERNLSGKLKLQTANGRKVTREVFDSIMYPGIVSIVLFGCYIASFSLFFAYGAPRCPTESLIKNEGWIYLAHKGACHVYNLGFLKLLLAVLIVAQTGLLMFYFYKSMAMDQKRNAGKLAKQMGGKAKEMGGKAKRLGVKGVRGAANATKKAANSIKQTAMSQQQKAAKQQQEAETNPNINRNATATKLQAAFRGRKARKVLKNNRNRNAAAAVKLQTAFRGAQARKSLKNEKKKRNAAVKLQRAMSRKKLTTPPPTTPPTTPPPPTPPPPTTPPTTPTSPTSRPLANPPTTPTKPATRPLSNAKHQRLGNIRRSKGQKAPTGAPTYPILSGLLS